jgi:hypothetical protein
MDGTDTGSVNSGEQHSIDSVAIPTRNWSDKCPIQPMVIWSRGVQVTVNISSRTPEGESNRCPVCGNVLAIEPSRPPGDAPCPYCGSLLWFSANRWEALWVPENVASRAPATAPEPAVPDVRPAPSGHRFSFTKKTRAILVVTAALGLVASAGAWNWWLTSRPLTEVDFDTVTGTLTNVDQRGGLLDLHISESSFRFRVPPGGPHDTFDREAFAANVRPGTHISIAAEKSQLERPRRPLLDSAETVFVSGLQDDSRSYYSLADRLRWDERNRFYGLLSAIAFSLTTIVLAFACVRKWRIGTCPH